MRTLNPGQNSKEQNKKTKSDVSGSVSDILGVYSHAIDSRQSNAHAGPAGAVQQSDLVWFKVVH